MEREQWVIKGTKTEMEARLNAIEMMTRWDVCGVSIDYDKDTKTWTIIKTCLSDDEHQMWCEIAENA